MESHLFYYLVLCNPFRLLFVESGNGGNNKEGNVFCIMKGDWVYNRSKLNSKA